MSYPLTLKWNFAPTFRTLKEAKIVADKYNTNVIKTNIGYIVKYEGIISNVSTTGRKFYVIDNEGNLHNEIISIIQSYPNDGTCQISGYNGIYVCRSNWHLDMYVSCNFDGSKLAENTIKELTVKGLTDYLAHTELCKPSKHLLKSLTQTDWDKAKELNYI